MHDAERGGDAGLRRATILCVRFTRFAHSCVRLERQGRALVIDPGIWSEPAALLGVDAVLVTHEHVDHVDELRLGAQHGE